MVAIFAAVGIVLFSIKKIMSPPQYTSEINDHEQDLAQESSSYNPETLDMKDALSAYNKIMDKIFVYQKDELVSDASFDNAVSATTEKFAGAFINWSFSIFSNSTWNSGDLQFMTNTIGYLRQVTIEKGNKKALQAESSDKFTKIESIIQQYKNAWNVARRTQFTSYGDAAQTVKEARQYASTPYLNNCSSLCNALNDVGMKLKDSRYRQLYARVMRLRNLNNFGSHDAYNSESSRVYDLINEFKGSGAFGVSTASDAERLGNMQDSFDAIERNYNWY